MKLYLKTLTPLHIGSGVELKTIDYVVCNRNYYRLTQKFVDKFIEENNLWEPYTKWINETANKINRLENRLEKEKRTTKNLEKEKRTTKNKDLNQELSDLYKNFNLLKFCDEQGKKEQFIKALNTSSGIIKIPLNGKYPGRKIREQIKDGKNTPYVPGTTIKGAIRTALLYHWLVNKKPVSEIIRIFERDLKKSEKAEELEKLKVIFASEIENLAFYCGVEKEKRIDYNDEKFDLLKLVSVSDGKIISPQNPLIIVKSDLFLMDNTRQGQSPWLEAIAPGCLIEFSLDFNISFLFSIKDKIKDDTIVIDEKKQWVGISTKTKELFGIDIVSLTKDNIEENRQKVIQHIFSKITLFSKRQKDKNEQWKDKIIPKHRKPGNQKENLFNKDKIDFSFIPEKNGLNLGFASGFIGTTEILYLLADPQLKDAFKKVMKELGIGANPDKFPKSRTMYDNGRKIVPFGWTEIVFADEIGKPKQTEEQNKAEPAKKIVERPPAPTYRIQKMENIREGSIVDAEVIGNQSPFIIVKLFVEGINESFRTRYAAGLREGTIIEVTVTSMSGGKKDKLRKILDVSFRKLKE